MVDEQFFMEDGPFFKEESELIDAIKNLIKRFEAIGKELQQPWRKCGPKEKEQAQDKIEDLKELIQDIKNGKLEIERAEVMYAATRVIADVFDVQFKYQNMQKEHGDGITPFDQIEI